MRWWNHPNHLLTHVHDVSILVVECVCNWAVASITLYIWHGHDGFVSVRLIEVTEQLEWKHEC